MQSILRHTQLSMGASYTLLVCTCSRHVSFSLGLVLGRTSVLPYHCFPFSPSTFLDFTHTMPSSKRQKISDDEISDEENDEEMLSASEEDKYSSDAGSSSAASEPDTEDEIADAKLAKSKKTLKRKRRATDAVNFGATLQSLLTTNAPAAPLSLKPSVAKRRREEKLEAKGKHVLQIEKKEKEDRGRVTDVIGGWGGESERALRKVAQRGGMLSTSPRSLILIVLMCLAQL